MTCCTTSFGRKLEPNWEVFRKVFPQYEDTTKYPDELFETVWEQVVCMVSDASYGAILGDCRLMLLYGMLCHMLTLAQNGANKGKQGGFISSSTIDKVSVTKAAPPGTTMFAWWLGQTPCGQQVMAMLELASVGGDYIGGSGEMGAFRRVGGQFKPGFIW